MIDHKLLMNGKIEATCKSGYLQYIQKTNAFESDYQTVSLGTPDNVNFYRVFVNGLGNLNFSKYTINQTTGSLTYVNSTYFTNSTLGGSNWSPQDAKFSKNGKNLYVLSEGRLLTFNRDLTTDSITFAALNAPSNATASFPGNIIVSTNYLYVCGRFNIVSYLINQTTGSLSLPKTSDTSKGTNSISHFKHRILKSESCMYALSSDNGLVFIELDNLGNATLSNTPALAFTLNNNENVKAFTFNSRFVYVLTSTSSSFGRILKCAINYPTDRRLYLIQQTTTFVSYSLNYTLDVQGNYDENIYIGNFYGSGYFESRPINLRTGDVGDAMYMTEIGVVSQQSASEHFDRILFSPNGQFAYADVRYGSYSKVFQYKRTSCQPHPTICKAISVSPYVNGNYVGNFNFIEDPNSFFNNSYATFTYTFVNYRIDLIYNNPNVTNEGDYGQPQVIISFLHNQGSSTTVVRQECGYTGILRQTNSSAGIQNLAPIIVGGNNWIFKFSWGTPTPR